MSRSTVAKSRTEKAGKSATIATPAVAHEIVPGKLNDQDWNSLLDRDDADSFVEHLVEDVCGSAVDIIFTKYIESQLVPYTVLQAKDALVQIIEWRFLASDSGEKSIATGPGWMQDEEPEPSIIDCWAQGSVPKTVREKEPQSVTANTPDLLKVEESFTELETLPQEESQEDDRSTDENVTQEDEAQEEPDELQHQQKQATPTPPAETEKPKKKRVRRVQVKREKSDGESTIEEGSKRSDTSKELQQGRPPGKQDVVFDKYGYVTDTSKIDVERIPSNRVKTRFVVVDPGMEAAKMRLEELRTGRRMKKGRPDIAPLSPPQRRARSPTAVVSSINPRRINTDSTALEGMASLPPPLIEAMQVSPGVAVREGDRVKRGPGQKLNRSEFMSLAGRHQLRPIRTQSDMPTISVMELVMNKSPVVRPIVETTPIPPIDGSPPLST